MKIGSFNIDNRSSVFIIAELSANHNGSLENALETIKAAKRAGADCIKLQTYTADTITIDCKKDDFKLKQGTIWDDKYFYELYQEAYTPWEWHKQLFETAEKEGLICFSSPFDKTAVDFLEELGVPAYKIASFEITDIPLIEYIFFVLDKIYIFFKKCGKKTQNLNKITFIINNLNLIHLYNLFFCKIDNLPKKMPLKKWHFHSSVV